MQRRSRAFFSTGRSYVVQTWIPPSTLLVLRGESYSYILGSEGILQRVQAASVDELDELVGPPFAPSSPGRPFDGTALTMTEGADGRFTLGVAIAVSDVAPAGFEADMSQRLERADRIWAQRTERNEHERDLRTSGLLAHSREKAGLKMLSLLGDPFPPEVVDGFTVSVARGRIRVTAEDRALVAYMDLPGATRAPASEAGPLIVLDEELRGAIVRLLIDEQPELASHLDPSVCEESPYLPARLWYSSQAGGWLLRLEDNGIGLASAVLGIYLPENKHCILAAETIAEAAIASVRRHGFLVETYEVVDIEEACFGRISRYPALMHLDLDPNQWWSTVFKVETGSAPTRASLRSSHLLENKLAYLPSPVSTLLRLGYGQHSPMTFAPTGDSGVWPEDLCETLARTVRAVDLPRSAEQHWATWREVSPWHAHMLTTVALMTSEPDWWQMLPPRQVKRVPRLGTGTIAPRNWDPSPRPVSLEAMSQQELAGTGNGDLLRLFHGWDRQQGIYLPGFAGADSANAAIVASAVLLRFGHPPPSRQLSCRLCGCSYVPSALAWRDVHGMISIEYCPGCVSGTQGTIDEFAFGAVTDGEAILRDGVAAALSNLMLRTAILPTIAACGRQLPSELEPDARDAIILLRTALPCPDEAIHGLGQRRPRARSEWLRLAGVLHSQRQGRGIPSTAADGHQCRSLLEREIDDWMFANNVWHEVEPSYPYDRDFNPDGSRGDWVLQDGTFVEAVGLLTDPAYVEKIARKQRLAEKLGLQLILIAPSDVSALQHLLKDR